MREQLMDRLEKKGYLVEYKPISGWVLVYNEATDLGIYILGGLIECIGEPRIQHNHTNTCPYYSCEWDEPDTLVYPPECDCPTEELPIITLDEIVEETVRALTDVKKQ